jgi:CheY-like chemotaxis protein
LTGRGPPPADEGPAAGRPIRDDPAPDERGDVRHPAGINHALLLHCNGSAEEASPAQFLEVDQWGAAVSSMSRPMIGESVRVALVDPRPTDWISATVMGLDLSRTPPYHLELVFRAPLSATLLSALLAEETAGPARRVLIVDDHDQTRAALGGFFRRRGYEVASAATLAEGLGLLRPAPWAIILDLVLPDGSGESILREVRRLGLPSRVAICTGAADPGQIAEIERLRPEALLMKPVELEELALACGSESS